MITDTLQYAAQYVGLHHRFRRAFEFLNDKESSELAPGKYELDGDRLFALVQHYETQPAEDAAYESHQKYIDIQYVSEGVERCGYAPVGELTEKTKYDEERDFALWTGDGSSVTLAEGSFIILYPQDAHMPGRTAGASPSSVKKIVLKVQIGE